MQLTLQLLLLPVVCRGSVRRLLPVVLTWTALQD